MSADVRDATSSGDVTAAYCPVCSPVYASAQYQRYAVPSTVNNGYCRRLDLDVFRPTHSPDLLGPLADTSVPAPSSTLQTCPGLSLRAVSCSAPDLIELSARLTVDHEHEQEDDDDDDESGRQVRCVTSFPARYVSQSTAVVCGQESPSRRRHRTMNDEC